MGMDPISMAMLGTKAFSAYQQYQAGEAAEDAYRLQAAEVAAQTAYAQRMALEEQKEIGAEGRSAEGRVRAAAGKSGLRVGGSVVTLSQKIARNVERRKALVGMQFSETARRSLFEQARLRYAGKQERYAGRVDAFGSLLTGGMQLAKRKEGLSAASGETVSWPGLFFKDRR